MREKKTRRLTYFQALNQHTLLLCCGSFNSKINKTSRISNSVYLRMKTRLCPRRIQAIQKGNVNIGFNLMEERCLRASDTYKHTYLSFARRIADGKILPPANEKRLFVHNQTNCMCPMYVYMLEHVYTFSYEMSICGESDLCTDFQLFEVLHLRRCCAVHDESFWVQLNYLKLLMHNCGYKMHWSILSFFYPTYCCCMIIYKKLGSWLPFQFHSRRLVSDFDYKKNIWVHPPFGHERQIVSIETTRTRRYRKTLAPTRKSWVH